MSLVWFISDLHLGHKKVLEFTKAATGAYRGGTTVDEHDEWVIDQCMSVKPDKRSLWWILGDVAMDEKKLPLINKLPGRKRLILGNHDLHRTQTYLNFFEWVGGTIKKYHMWLSHMPIHPHEFRGIAVNVHGHCHYGPIRRGYGDPDPRYLNLAIDWAPENRPVSLEDLRARYDLEKKDDELPKLDR